MPGDNLHKIRKAASSGVDVICMDMEDGVAPNRKAEARRVIAGALQAIDFGRSEKLARINAVNSGLELDDLAAVLPYRPDGIVIPKVDNAGQIQMVDEIIADTERRLEWPIGMIGIIAIVESARGLINLAQIAGASSRLSAIVFGAEDYASDIGALRTPNGLEVLYARSAVVAYCAAFDLQAIDIVYLHYQDLDGLEQEALQGAQMGFSGKQIIHPAQIAPVQSAFTPSAAQVEWAGRVLAAADAHAAEGRGAFSLDGKMIDAPLIKAAHRILARLRMSEKDN
jgi:citrate lyase beta subunit